METPLPTRRSPDHHDILLGILAAHQPPPASFTSGPPSSSSASFASSPKSRSPTSFSIPASVAAPPPPAPTSASHSFHLSECHRAKWVGDRRAAAGARGIVSAVSARGGECSLMLNGPVATAASFHTPPSSDQASPPDVRLHWRHGAAAAAALAPLRDAWAPLPVLLTRREEASKEPSFIAATNPECALLAASIAAESKLPLPLLSWRVGEAAAPIYLRASLRRRAIVRPFKSAAELNLRLSSAPSPLTSLRVVIHAGRVLGDADAELVCTSAFGSWDKRRRVFCVTLPQLQPHTITRLRLQFVGDAAVESDALGELEDGGATFALIDARCCGLSSLAGAVEEEQASSDASLQAVAFVDDAGAARYEEARVESEPPAEEPGAG